MATGLAVSPLGAAVRRIVARLEEVPAPKHLEAEGPCLVWLGAKSQGGYGYIRFEGALVPVHRLVFAAWAGLRSDQVIDHHCENRSCINPAHLSAGTQRANILRSATAIPALNARKVECLNGHPFSGENLVIRRTRYGWGRHCRACALERQRESRRRKRLLLKMESR